MKKWGVVLMIPSYLVDTHVVLWAVLNPDRISGRVSKLLMSESALLVVSTATVWEIATKVRLGKLPGAESLEQNLLGWLENAGYSVAPLTPSVALRAGRLRGEHKDPFDRMIAAQALEADIPILSIDKELDVFGVQRIW